MLNAWKRLAVLALLFTFIGSVRGELAQGQAAAAQGTTLSLISPPACPAAGCAPGQRLNFRFQFAFESYDPTPTDPPSANVQVCIYAPTNWVDLPQVSTTLNGGITGLPYATAAACSGDFAPPDGYQLIAARETTVQQSAFGDTLEIALRLAAAASTPGTLYARVLERSTTGWTITADDFTAPLPVIALPVEPVQAYIAVSASECDSGAYSPCFVNSGDDLADGYGTGLKDAVDIVPAGSTLSIVGNYLIKSSIVVLSRPVTLTGLPGSKISYTGSLCSNPMLSLRDGVTLRGLNIDDGSVCSGAHRNLVEINSPAAVQIESSHFTDGDQAIFIVDNSGPVSIRYNHIENNSGFAIFWENGQSQASLEVVANNIIGNGNAINCGSALTAPAANRKANHNYWGSTTPPSQDATHCTITTGKQLGAPVALRSGQAGVQAERVTVTGDKQYAFNNQIAYQYSGSDPGFSLFIVNHGYALESALPFTQGAGASPNPCSNYWDVFLADGAAPTGALTLFVKYDKSDACIAAINSTRLCDQTTDKSIYPLWWYDPAFGITSLWDTTGQNPAGANAAGAKGQDTACSIDNREISVAIDNDGRPNLSNDLNHMPIMAGIEILQTFRLLSSSNTITVDWSTYNEADIAGFYVLRSVDNTNFNPITDLIPRKGSALSGASYQHADAGRTAGTTYYYRLKIVRSDGHALYSATLSAVGTAATPTITATLSRTPTFTRTPGPSPTFTVPPPKS